jgi:hypothetical protein
MTRKATCLEDIGDERDQAVFMASVEILFDGDFQAALDHYNKSVEEDEEYRRKKKAALEAKSEDERRAEMVLRYATHQ